MGLLFLVFHLQLGLSQLFQDWLIAVISADHSQRFYNHMFTSQQMECELGGFSSAGLRQFQQKAQLLRRSLGLMNTAKVVTLTRVITNVLQYCVIICVNSVCHQLLKLWPLQACALTVAFKNIIAN